MGLEIDLKNGDKITGLVIGENAASLLVRTQETGDIAIHKALIDLSKTNLQ